MKTENIGKTHFADDDTLKYISELEGTIKLLTEAIKKSIERHSMYFGTQKPGTLTVLECALKETGLKG